MGNRHSRGRSAANKRTQGRVPSVPINSTQPVNSDSEPSTTSTTPTAIAGPPSQYGMDAARLNLTDPDVFGAVAEELVRSKNDEGQLAALKQVCALLCYRSNNRDLLTSIWYITPKLMEIAGSDGDSETILLSVRAITYICNVDKSVPVLLSRIGIVSVLCRRLLEIKYTDVAELCLQSLEKISVSRPLSCLKAGAAMACLKHFDFFSVSIQRVAVSAVRNMCNELPLSCYRFVMDAFPTLCNILNHEDPKLIETTGSCLMRIAESFGGSPDILNELSNHSLIQNCVNLITSKSEVAIRKANNNSLIGFLARLACGSPKAVKILLEINISSTLKDILSAYDAPQVHETLKLLIHLLPNISILDTRLSPISPNISLQDADIQVSLEKKKIFTEQPKVLHQFAVDVLPSVIRVVSSGANLQVCYACVCIAQTIVEISNSTVLVSLLEESKISRFIARLFTTKDPHMLVPVLRMVGTLLYKHYPTFVNLFVREGIFHKIEELLENSRQNVSHNRNKHTLVSSSQMYKSDSPRCLCYEFDLCQTASSSETDCKLKSGIATTLAKHIKVFYFPLPRVSGTGSSEIMKLLKSHSLLLNEMVNMADYSSEGEECLSWMLEQIITGLLNCEEMTTFELIASGVLKSIAHYLSNGQYLEQKCDLSAQSHSIIVSHRFEAFSKVIMSKHFQHGRRLLVQNLQTALSSQNDFHVVTDVPLQHYPMDRFFKILFIRDAKESFLLDYSFNTVTIKPTSLLNDVVKQIWPNIRPDIEQHLESRTCLTGITTDNILRTTDDNASLLDASYFTSNGGREKRLVFYLDGKELSQSLTLYQAILQHKMSTEHDMTVRPEFWEKVYTIVYRTAELPDANSGDSFQFIQKGEEILEHRSKDSTPEYDVLWPKLPFFSTLLSGKLPCELEKSLASYDILYMLNLLEGLNRCTLCVLSDEQCTAFAEGKISQIEDLNLVEYALPQSEFLNLGLNEKLEQQMGDSSSLSIGCMPAWCTQLTSSCPFLFSFKTRCKFFRLSTSDNSVYRHHPCLQRGSNTIGSRRTFKVDRGNILVSASKMMATDARSKDVFEVQYNGEIGSGIGPTMEFYTLVSLEFQKVGLGMWREDHTSSVSGLITAPLGLFPRPWSDTRTSSTSDRFAEVLKKYTLLGRIVARVLLDKRIFDLPLSKSFYKMILGKELGIHDILSFDPELGKTLIKFQSIAKRKRFLDNNNEKSSCLLFHDAKLEDLCIEFSLPGYSDYAFAFTKDHDMVSDINLEEYVTLVVDATVRSGILRQLEAFKQGFNEVFPSAISSDGLSVLDNSACVFPLQSLQLFSEDEIERLLCGEQDAWNLSGLLDHIKFGHGYRASSFAAMNFMEVIQEFDRDQRRNFLQFVTGAPRLPPGGLASLKPKMTVVCKHCRDSDMTLPSAMTCFNYLKLPSYSSKEIMKERLLFAITEGQGSFHLS